MADSGSPEPPKDDDEGTPVPQAQASEVQRAWNILPSVGSWLNLTCFQVEAANGTVSWSASALAQLPFEQQLKVLHSKAGSLTVVGLERLQRFLLCLPPRKPTGWTRTRCATCFQEFQSRDQLIVHLNRFALSDERCCRITPAERQFLFNFPSDELVDTARAASKLGVGSRFFPVICPWLEATKDSCETSKRLASLASLDPAEFELVKEDLLEWLRRHTDNDFLVSLMDELDDKPQIMLINLALETSDSLSGSWYYSDDDFRNHFTLRRADPQNYSFEETFSDGIVTGRLSQSVAWYEGPVSKGNQPHGILRVRFGDGKVITNFKSSEGEAWGKDIIGYSKDTNDSKGTKNTKHTKDSGQVQFIASNTELQADTSGLGFRSSKQLDQKSEGVVDWESSVTGVDEQDGWLRVGKEYLPMRVDACQVLFKVEAPRGCTLDGRWNKGTITGTLLTWSDSGEEEYLTEVRHNSCKLREFAGQLKEDNCIHWSNGSIWTRVEEPSLLNCLVAGLLNSSRAGSGLQALLNTEGETLVSITEAVLEAARHEVTRKRVDEQLPPCLAAGFGLVTRLASCTAQPRIGIRALQVVTKLLQGWPADGGSLLDFIPKFVKLVGSEVHLLHSLVIALLGETKVESRLQTLLSTEGETLVCITEGVLEASTHDRCREVLNKELPPLLTAEFGLVSRLVSFAADPSISVRALKAVTKLLREWRADEGRLLDSIPRFIKSLGSEVQLLHSLVIALLRVTKVESTLQSLLSMEGETLICITEGVFAAAISEDCREVVQEKLPPLLTADFGLISRLASNASDERLCLRALKVVTKLLREWRADEGRLFDSIPTFMKSLGSELQLLHSLVIAIIRATKVESTLQTLLSTKGEALICITEAVLEAATCEDTCALVNQKLPLLLTSDFGLVPRLASTVRNYPSAPPRVLKVVTQLVREWHAEEGHLIFYLPDFVKSLGGEDHLLHPLITALLNVAKVESRLRILLKTEGVALVCFIEAVLKAAKHDVSRAFLKERLPPLLSADFGLVTRLANNASVKGMGLRTIKVVTELLQEWHADPGSLVDFFPSFSRSIGGELQLLHSLVIALLACRDVESRLRTLLSVEGPALVFIVEGVLEAAKHEVSGALVREKLTLFVTADFGLVGRLARNTSSANICMRALRVVTKLLQEWDADEGSLLDSISDHLRLLGTEVQEPLNALVVVLLSGSKAATRLRTLLSKEYETLVCISDSVLEAAQSQVSRAAVEEHLPRLLVGGFDLVFRLATSATDPKIGPRALQTMTRLLREWHAEEGALSAIIPNMFQSLANSLQSRNSLPITPGATALAALLRCLSQRNSEVLNQLIADEAVVMAVVQLVSNMEPTSRNFPPVIELARALLGEDYEGYETRLAALGEWGISEDELEMPGQPRNRAPKLELKCGREDVLRSTISQVLQANVGSLQRRKFKVQFSEAGGMADDHGGPRREFLAKAGAQLCHARLNLLLPAQSEETGYFQLSPVPGLLGSQDLRDNPEGWCKFLGRLLGVAVVHGEPMGVLLVPSLCKSLVGEEPSFDDLKYVDAGWHTSLKSMSRDGVAPMLMRLPSVDVDEYLSEQKAEVTSKPAFIFEALASHIETAGDFQVELAEMLLKAAATSSQRGSAVEAATKVLESSSAPERARLLAAAYCLPHSREVDRFIELVRSQHDDESPIAKDLNSSGQLLLEYRAGRLRLSPSRSKVVDQDISSGSGQVELELPSSASAPDLTGLNSYGQLELVYDAGRLHLSRARSQEMEQNAFPGSVQEEKRVANDGKSYTKAEFQQHYEDSWQSRWDAASPDKAAPVVEVEQNVAPPMPALLRDKSAVAGCGISAGEPLNSKNVDRFREAVARKLLLDNLQPHLKHMCDEFRAVVQHPAAKQNRTWEDVQNTIAGAKVDVTLWRRWTHYSGGFSDDSPVIAWWWKLLEDRGDLFQRRVFTFVTGYASMPESSIRIVMHLADDATRLPTARTCTTTLNLPAYPSQEVLSHKLEWALTEQGFQLV